MLRNGGFDASINFGTDAYQNMADGKPGLYMFGHGASLFDPYAALDLFHGRYSDADRHVGRQQPLLALQEPRVRRHARRDGAAGSDDPKFQELAAKALGIYWRDTIDIPIIQWLHRIAYNQTYWTNWPTAANPPWATNGAFWAQTGLLVVTSLQQAQVSADRSRAAWCATSHAHLLYVGACDARRTVG